jgi:signal transduction histidine kinase
VKLSDEDDLAILHRRTRQVSSALGFPTSQQTQIGTAISELTRAALKRAGGAKLDFSLVAGMPGALCVRIHDYRPAQPRVLPGLDNEIAVRIARQLMDEVQIELSPLGATSALLRRLLPADSPPLTDDRIHEIREELSYPVSKDLVQELHEQNRELRQMQSALVLSEISLRQRVRQSALTAEVAAVLIGTESIAEKLQRCSEEMVQRLDIECALIWTADRVRCLTRTASAGTSCGHLPSEAELGNSHLGLIARERKPYATNSVLDDPQTADRDWAAQHQLQAFAGYPLVIGGKLLGVLAVYARWSLASDALDTLRLLANQIAIGVESQQRLEEREALLASEREARLRAERATQARDRLLAVVSHDLRNPLSSIVTAAALLTRAPMLEEPRLRKHLQTILSSADRMKRLISDLLDLASLEIGRLTLDLTRQAVAPLVSEVVELHAPMAEAKSVVLEAKVADLLPEIRCDRGRIVQVLSNLIGNAIKFTPSGGAISVRAAGGGSAVVFAVADTGPGMSDEEQAHVFQSHWQGRRGAGHGFGLGLSIARGLVESHGGKIWLESRTGEGSTFFVTLPAQPELAQAEQRSVG